jgi:putative hydrolase of the HAD superfamily
MIKAVLWDFGGVILASPFDAFNRYEAQHGLPRHFLRTVNSTNPHTNAWALLERNEISMTQFDDLFAAESAALGHRVPGVDVLSLLGGAVRPEIIAAVDRVRSSGYRVACLTNNVVSDGSRGEEIDAIMQRFDVVVESSVVGVRKPEARFYEIACEMLMVEPAECVFLDDLGVNLKPAAAMGMTTIKVATASQAIADLGALLGW